MSGDTYTAEQLHAMGVVDLLAQDGEGERVIRDHIHRHERRHKAHLAIYKARNVVTPVSLEEMVLSYMTRAAGVSAGLADAMAGEAVR